jgi:uncharacterized protein
MKYLHIVAFLLLVVGGINWLLFGLFNWDIGMLFGGMDSAFAKIIYVLVGLAAIFEFATHKKSCSACCAKGSSDSAAPTPQAPVS